MAEEPIRLTIEFNSAGEAVVRNVKNTLEGLRRQVERVNLFGASGRVMRTLQADINRTANALRTNLIGAVNLAERGFSRLTSSLSRLARIGFVTATVALAGFTAAMVQLGKEFININEQFQQLEITLRSTFRSVNIARELRRELVKITATSPIPFKDLAEFVRAASVNPFQRAQLAQQQVSQGNFSDPDGFLRSSVKLVEQIRAFRPDKAVEDIIFSIREAFGGEFRSLVRRFDVPLSIISAQSKIPVAELKTDPAKVDKALKDFFGQIITPQAISELLRQPQVLIENIAEQLLRIPLLSVGDAGLFKNIIDYMEGIFLRAQEFALNELQPIADDISKVLSDIFDSLTETASIAFEGALSSFGAGRESLPDLSLMGRVATVIGSAIQVVSEKLPKFLSSSKEFLDVLVPALLKLTEFFLNVTKFVAEQFNARPIITALTLLFTTTVPNLLFAGISGLINRFTGTFSQQLLSRVGGPPLPPGSIMLAGGTRPSSFFRSGQVRFQPSVGAAAVSQRVPSGLGALTGAVGGTVAATAASAGVALLIGAIVAAITVGFTKVYNLIQERRDEAAKKINQKEEERLDKLIRALTRGNFGDKSSADFTTRFLRLSEDTTNLGAIGPKDLSTFVGSRLDAFRATGVIGRGLGGSSVGRTGVQLTDYLQEVFQAFNSTGALLDKFPVDTKNIEIQKEKDILEKRFTTLFRELNAGMADASNLVEKAALAMRSTRLDPDREAKLNNAINALSKFSSESGVFAEAFGGDGEGNFAGRIESLTSAFRSAPIGPLVRVVQDFETKALGGATPFAADIRSSAEILRQRGTAQTALSDVRATFGAASGSPDVARREQVYAQFLRSRSEAFTDPLIANRTIKGEFFGVRDPKAPELAQLLLEQAERVASGALRESQSRRTRTDLVARISGMEALLLEGVIANFETKLTPILSKEGAGVATDQAVGDFKKYVSSLGLLGSKSLDDIIAQIEQGAPNKALKGSDAIASRIESKLGQIGALEIFRAAAGDFVAQGGSAVKIIDLIDSLITKRKQLIEIDRESLLIEEKKQSLLDVERQQKIIRDRGFSSLGGLGSFLDASGSATSQRRALESTRNISALGLSGTLDFSTLALPSAFDSGLDNLIKKYDYLLKIGPTWVEELRSQADITEGAVSKGYKDAADSLEDFIDQIETAKKELTGGGFFESMSEGFQGAVQRMKIAGNDFRDFGATIAESISTNFGRAFADIVRGAKTAEDAFHSMGLAIVDALLQIAAQKFAQQLFGFAFGAILPASKGPSPYGTGSSIPQGVDPGAFAGVASTGGQIYGGSGVRDDVPILATGGEFMISRRGVRSVGVPFLQAINEGRVPKFQGGGSIGGSGGGVSPVHVEINMAVDARSAQGQGSERSQGDSQLITKEIESAVVSIMQKHSRPGGALYTMGRKNKN